MHPIVITMKILSVNVGRPRQIVSNGKSITTGIFKTPIHKRIKVSKLNIEGDGQADLSVHGGLNKAVYGYPSEHYDYWRREFPSMELPWGMFGENLSMKGLLEDDVHIGDRFRMGTAILMVTQPRLPCYKLGIKFDRDDMPERFLASGRTGFYFAVIEEGELGEGDAVERIEVEANRVSVTDILSIYLKREDHDVHLLERALQVEALPPGWRRRILKKLDESKASSTDGSR
jgi:MOSC domain-containing protein YiiM